MSNFQTCNKTFNIFLQQFIQESRLGQFLQYTDDIQRYNNIISDLVHFDYKLKLRYQLSEVDLFSLGIIPTIYNLRNNNFRI